MATGDYNPETIAANIKLPEAAGDNCYGYENVDSKGCYLSTLKLATGVVDMKGLNKDEVLAGIVSYDRAEKNTAYIGQINMITVSSFSGPNAAVWGYDLAQSDTLRDKLLFSIPEVIQTPVPERYKCKVSALPRQLQVIPVYDVQPLLDATQSLFGTVDNRRFPPLAGAHVPCAAKSANSTLNDDGTANPGWVWCFIALAIAVNRDRDACLFVEDAGFYSDADGVLTEAQVQEKLNIKRLSVVYSQWLCGVDQDTPFKEIFVGYTYRRVNSGEYGCALTCAPYVLLPSDAYPNGSPSQLVSMKLSEWEAAVSVQQTKQKKSKK